MVTARELLNRARLRKGWSIADLHEESKVKTHPTNLRRKLIESKSPKCKRPGPVALDPIEVEQLARALGVSIPHRVFTADLMAGRIARCRTANEAE